MAVIQVGALLGTSAEACNLLNGNGWKGWPGTCCKDVICCLTGHSFYNVAFKHVRGTAFSNQLHKDTRTLAVHVAQ